MLQEAIHESNPSIIIETGTYCGGSALYYADMGVRVVSIDTWEQTKPKVKHPLIKLIKGRSTDRDVIYQVNGEIKKKDRVMVILDSDHETKNVENELKLYSPLVTSGCYLIVQDTNIGGNPVYNSFVPGDGPMPALLKFMKGNKDFLFDKSKERYMMTFNPNGWLKRI